MIAGRLCGMDISERMSVVRFSQIADEMRNSPPPDLFWKAFFAGSASLSLFPHRIPTFTYRFTPDPVPFGKESGFARDARRMRADFARALERVKFEEGIDFEAD